MKKRKGLNLMIEVIQVNVEYMPDIKGYLASAHLIDKSRGVEETEFGEQWKWDKTVSVTAKTKEAAEKLLDEKVTKLQMSRELESI